MTCSHVSSGKTTCHDHTSVESHSLPSITAEYSSLEAPYLWDNSAENTSTGSSSNKNNHVTRRVRSHATKFAKTPKEKDS